MDTLLSQEGLEFIFVGGKGGVGKTTCSCAIACLVAQKKRDAEGGDVLLVSTDPVRVRPRPRSPPGAPRSAAWWAATTMMPRPRAYVHHSDALTPPDADPAPPCRRTM